MTVSLSVSDIQIDNQLFSRSSFDFPVLIINQNTQRRPELIDLSTDIIKWMDAARENAAVMVDFNIETWREELRDSNVTGTNLFHMILFCFAFKKCLNEDRLHTLIRSLNLPFKC